MTLEPGARLGPYEVVGPLGAGGMGEVYRARDSRLGREVAIKLLPPAWSHDAARLRRFEDEARAVSALNHPNIVAVFDMGGHEGAPYVVLELLEGQTLRDRIGDGALPARKAVEIAAQIARGLAAAHAKGIVHRDLKPENVHIGRDGHVKILDFGIAKLQPGGEAERGELPTEVVKTEPGTVLGTAGYMAPEQVRGEVVDARADLFSLGAILYEMLAGRRAFRGDTTAEAMVAVLREEPPDLGELNPALSPALVRVVRHCLEKNADERFVSARDLAFDLDVLATTSAAAPRVEAPRAWSRRAAMVPLAAALMATAGAGFWLGRLGSESVSPTYRPLTFRRGILTAARFSPDGGQFLYSAAWDGGPSQLYAVRPDVRGEQSLDVPGRLAGSAAGELVAVRPDRVLLRAPLSGGTAREAVENVRLADLSRDGTRLAIVRLADGRDRIESPPGTVVYATTGEILLLRFAPDDRRLAFVERPNSGFNPARVGVVEPGGQPRLLTPEHYIISLAWSPDGDEIWFSSVRGPGGNELRAVSMSGKDRVLLRTAQWPMIHDVRPDGRALLELRDMRYEVVGRGAGGSEERTLSWDEDPEAYDVSADGRTFTFAVAGTAASQGGVGTGAGRDRVVTATVTAYLGRMDGGPPVRLGDGLPTGMSPDGRWVATISKQGRTLTLLPTGAGEPRHPPPGTLRYYYDVRYFADGQSILISGNEEGRPRRLFRQDLAGGVPHAVTPEGIETEYPIPSPDGRWVAAGPNWREAPYALYPLDGGEPRSVPGLDKGEQPLRFDASGQRLFVRSGNIPVRVFLLDLATGRREPWREIGPADRAGWLGLSWIYPTADGRSYMYQYRRILSTLYLVEGLR